MFFPLCFRLFTCFAGRRWVFFPDQVKDLVIHAFPLADCDQEILLDGEPALSRSVRLDGIDHFEIIIMYKNRDKLVHFLWIRFK